ncbi:MAG: NAD(P)H-hydrate dehydratase [Chloroflexi bacterium]|nr:NAD(P)H-hydrate dehydratase [Chloroflexota bacterium]
MRRLESQAVEAGTSTDTLMERAGLAVARKARERVAGRDHVAQVVVLVGPGNNGGDGLVTARHLADWGCHTAAYLCGARRAEDPKLELAARKGAHVIAATDDPGLSRLRTLLADADLVVDAVLGTGVTRPMGALMQGVFKALAQERGHRSSMVVLALDLPSGLNADTGEVDSATPVVDLTVTLGFPKVGLFLFPGAAHVGHLEVVDIGIPQGLAGDVSLELMEASWVQRSLPTRPPWAHKGTFGRVLAVVGSWQYVGAAYLACMGAARGGAGYVTLATPAGVYPILAGKLTEVTHLPLPEVSPDAVQLVRQAMGNYDALLMGCGLGQGQGAEALVRGLLAEGPPLPLPKVLDADALNLLAKLPSWWERLGGAAVVTPHPGEMARLLGQQGTVGGKERIATARDAARRWRTVVVLKGAFTVVASPQGDARVSPFANPALATAGTGDVLAGLIAGLLAQGMGPYDAAAAGVYLHGAAGELVRQEVGDAGALASDLLPLLPRVIHRCKKGELSLP